MISDGQVRFYLETLQNLVSIPTASFHEEGVCAAIKVFLDRYNIPYEIDPYGNIIAHYQKGPTCRPLALMAHTDHPAFELLTPGSDAEFEGATWTARLLGGVGIDWFKEERPVKIFAGNDPASPVAATLLGGRVVGGPRQINLFLRLNEPSEALVAGNFGIWDLPDFVLGEELIQARVIDDLVGCTAALLTLWKLAQDSTDTNVYGVFTRAEEVGLVGAELVFAQKILPPETYVVSLEASRALPGAVQGEGPVIRVGDRGFTFSEEAEYVLKVAAESLREHGLPKVQRQLMSGGRCEASTAILQGYLATGLAFPLGNYHNMAEGYRLETENIHRQDFLTGVALLQEAARLLPELSERATARLAAETTSQILIDRLTATREIIAGQPL